MARGSQSRRPRQLPDGLHIDAFGARIDLTRKPGLGEVPTTARALCEIGYADFGGTCPLCTRRLTGTPAGRLGSAEHVPPLAVGGTVRTRTCQDCNSRGASAEADLVRWWAKEYPARFQTPGLTGSRAGGSVLLRGTTDGRFALIVSGHPADGVRRVLATAGLTDEVTGTFALPNGRWKFALLKAAYLAACVHLGEVPNTPDAEYTRAVIRSGTFGPREASVGTGNDALPFRIFRIYEVDEAEARRVWIGVAALPWMGGDVPIFGVGLGAVAFVTWPLPDLRHRAIALIRPGFAA
jgi:hypothetical protein